MKPALLLSLILVCNPTLAGGLAEHTQEIGLDFSYSDTSDDDNIDTPDDGEAARLAFRWLYATNGGRIQVGGRASYSNVEPNGGSGWSETIVGPVVVFNAVPQKTATPFFSLDAGVVGGDAGDVSDLAWTVNIGMRGFIGDSAALNVSLFGTRLTGPNEDRDRAGLLAGVSFFFGKRSAK